MGVPSASGLRLDVGETHAGGRIGDANEMLAAGTLDLPPGMARFALQRLITVGTVKLEFSCAHRFYLHKRKNRDKSISKYFSILFFSQLRLNR